MVRSSINIPTFLTSRKTFPLEYTHSEGVTEYSHSINPHLKYRGTSEEDGILVGKSDIDGAIVGPILGDEVGVGSIEGLAVGTTCGDLVGFEIGAEEKVGVAVGSSVGVSD